mgnify:CR=1 FL=1
MVAITVKMFRLPGGNYDTYKGSTQTTSACTVFIVYGNYDTYKGSTQI